MTYRSLRKCVDDLQREGQLVLVDSVIDARLEAAEIQRRVYRSGGPALLFSNVRACRFPMVSNLFGTIERARFIFRDTYELVRRVIELKIEPNNLWQQPTRYWRAPLTALRMLPRVCSNGAVLANETSVGQLPQLVSWPEDGGAFITLPQVYTEDVDQPGVMRSNLGMYRIQMSGNQYETEREIGLHYQIHRGIGVHQAKAMQAGKPFKVNIFVGGTPAMTLSAVMPLPEGMSELTFAGALAGHRIRMITFADHPAVYADADFCITGTVYPDRSLPEGPFGDHLGYYSLAHPFPVLTVDKVYHRNDAIWPFTVVGRPPQEDTVFGQLIHELTGPIIPTVIPGVHAVHAVDAAGVHPLMLAIGSERYTPYQQKREPAELLTQANAVLGQGQMSLAKYLLIVDREDDPQLEIHDIASFIHHLLQRIDWRRDLHFHTRTTIDTLDYSGSGLNQGSKLVMAAVGRPIRELATSIPAGLRLPEAFADPRVCLPGVLAVRGPAFAADASGNDAAVEKFCNGFCDEDSINQFPLIVIVDESDFTARTLENFLWVVFTRSNPAADVYGIGASTYQKHWGCRGSLVIDARIKPHHAPPLIEDPQITKKIDAMAARGGPLAKYL
ncbi:MAG: UbiD family decarboxylase [Planctomycetaceae bacterium]|nr:UbiD family decarboxylase [Planctomycetales bacterium]MCB9923425.1 UbiD family decarboxylase [Planctomycetaceae bacterium]